MKKTEAMSVGEIIRQALTQSGNEHAYATQQACFMWSEIVGPSINRYTTRRWIDRDVLHVCLSSAVLKNELSFHLDSLVKKINEAVGSAAISKIVLH